MKKNQHISFWDFATSDIGLSLGKQFLNIIL